MSDTAWVTLATNDGYAVGALVLAHSLRSVGTQHSLHILYTNGVSTQLRDQLNAVFTSSTLVDVLDSNDAENLALIKRPDLGVTFTKLHCWRLTQYSKCVFLDADTLVVQNSDELFERPDFSAAPDIGWPDFFNTGVFVFAPSLETYRKLTEFGIQHGTFDGGDQGLLNQFYSGWREWDGSHRLPFVYNVTSGAIYSYAAALKRHSSDIKIVHFLGSQKPWHSLTTGVHGNEHWSQWHSIFDANVKQHLPAHLIQYWYGLPLRKHTKRHTKRSDAHHHHHHHSHPEVHHHESRHQQHEVQSPVRTEVQHTEVQHCRHPSPPREQPYVPPPESPPSPAPVVEHTPVYYPPPVVTPSPAPPSPPPTKLDTQYDDEVTQPTDEISVTMTTISTIPIDGLPDGLASGESSRRLSVSSSASSDASDYESDSSSTDANKWEQRYEDWERGAPDYTGRDAFEHIQRHLEKTLGDDQ